MSKKLLHADVPLRKLFAKRCKIHNRPMKHSSMFMVAKYYDVVPLFVTISTTSKLFIHRQCVVRSSINLFHLHNVRLVIIYLNLILEILVNFNPRGRWAGFKLLEKPPSTTFLWTLFLELNFKITLPFRLRNNHKTTPSRQMIFFPTKFPQSLDASKSIMRILVLPGIQ